MMRKLNHKDTECPLECNLVEGRATFRADCFNSDTPQKISRSRPTRKLKVGKLANFCDVGFCDLPVESQLCFLGLTCFASAECYEAHLIGLQHSSDLFGLQLIGIACACSVAQIN